MEIDTSMNRRKLLKIGGGMGVMALLAACGSDDDDDEPASSAAADTGGATSAAAEGTTAAAGDTAAATGGGVSLNLDPSTEQGELQVFDWIGYEDTAGCPDACYGFWDPYVNGPYGKSNPLKFTFLEDDQQALAKVAAGFKTDLVHPCIAYTKNWMDAGLIQPWDTSYITGWDTINPKLYEAGVFDGKVYAVPWDWGYSSLVYRSDKVDVGAEESWSILLDPKYEGRIGIFSDGVAIIKIGGLINGVADPNKMSQEEIDAAKETMIKAKPQIRTFWTNQTDAIKEVVDGNLDITYGWPDAWLSISAALPDAGVKYMQPKEGRLAWTCAYVLSSETPRPALAHEMMKAIPTAENAVALIDGYAYGAAGAGTPEILAQVQNQDLITTFGLDDLDKALAPPSAWPEAYLPNRADYVKAAEEVKAA